MTDVSGVRMSWARYATSSFLRVSAAFAARSSESARFWIWTSSERAAESSSGSSMGANLSANRPVTAADRSSSRLRARFPATAAMASTPQK